MIMTQCMLSRPTANRFKVDPRGSAYAEFSMHSIAKTSR